MQHYEEERDTVTDYINMRTVTHGHLMFYPRSLSVGDKRDLQVRSELAPNSQSFGLASLEWAGNRKVRFLIGDNIGSHIHGILWVIQGYLSNTGMPWTIMENSIFRPVGVIQSVAPFL